MQAWTPEGPRPEADLPPSSRETADESADLRAGVAVGEAGGRGPVARPAEPQHPVWAGVWEGARPSAGSAELSMAF